MLFLISRTTFFFNFFFIDNYIYSEYCQSYKKDIRGIRDFIFENYCKKINFLRKTVKTLERKDLLLLANKIEKIFDPCNA